MACYFFYALAAVVIQYKIIFFYYILFGDLCISGWVPSRLDSSGARSESDCQSVIVEGRKLLLTQIVAQIWTLQTRQNYKEPRMN